MRAQRSVAAVAVAILATVGLHVACRSVPRDEATDSGRVVFRISKPHGLLNFVQTIHGDAHRSPILRELFEGSRFDDETTRRHLEAFDQARRNLELGVSFGGYPVERRMGRNLFQLFRIQSGMAHDLDDLRERSLGMLPQSDHTRLFESLAALEPVYDELIWNPHQAELESYLERLTREFAGWRVEAMFETAATFYGAEWPEDMPFTVVLYPLPGSEGTTSAESIGSFESVGVLLGERDLTTRFGVIFHEMCHSLYEAQPAAFQYEFERLFTESESPHARLAYQQINEGLATALGNGRAYEQASGRANTGDWYDDEQVDRFSKALHPLVVEYVEQSQRIDAEFVEQAIEIFAAEFPDAIYEYSLLLNKILLMTDGRTIRSDDVAQGLRRHFRVSSISSSSPIDHARSLATVEETGETLVVVVSEADKQQLAALTRVFPPLEVRLDELLAERDDYVYASVDERGRAWVIVKVDDLSSIPAAVDRMHARGRIDPSVPLERLSR